MAGSRCILRLRAGAFASLARRSACPQSRVTPSAPPTPLAFSRGSPAFSASASAALFSPSLSLQRGCLSPRALSAISSSLSSSASSAVRLLPSFSFPSAHALCSSACGLQALLAPSALSPLAQSRGADSSCAPLLLSRRLFSAASKPADGGGDVKKPTGTASPQEGSPRATASSSAAPSSSSSSAWSRPPQASSAFRAGAIPSGFFARWCSAGAVLRLLGKASSYVFSALVRFTKAFAKYLKLFITNPMIVKKWYKKGKEGAIHTWRWTVTGFSLFYANVRVSYQLLKKKILGHPLRYNEHKLLVRTMADAMKLIPFSLMIIIPLGELLLPVVLRLFPNMLPSTFFEKQVDNAYLSRKLKAKQELAAFFQELVREHTKNIIEQESNDALKDKAKALKEFQEKLLQKDQRDVDPFLSVSEILSFARLFKEEFVLEKLDLQTLQVMCRLLGLQPYGMRSHVVLQLRYHLNHIHREDREFMWEGVDTLSHDELVEACKDRAMKFHNISDDDMREEMRQWLAISSHKDIPPLLLLWCRCISLTHSHISPPVPLAPAPAATAPAAEPVAPAPVEAARDAVQETAEARRTREAEAAAAQGGGAPADAPPQAEEAATTEASKEAQAAKLDEEDAEEEEKNKRKSATLEAMERQVQLLRAEEEMLRESVRLLQEEEAQRQRQAEQEREAKAAAPSPAAEEAAPTPASSPLSAVDLLLRDDLGGGGGAQPEAPPGEPTRADAEEKARLAEERSERTEARGARSAARVEPPQVEGSCDASADSAGGREAAPTLDAPPAASTASSLSEDGACGMSESEALALRTRRMEMELRLLRRLADVQHQQQEEAFGALSRVLEVAQAYRLHQEVLERTALQEKEVLEKLKHAEQEPPPPPDAKPEEQLKAHEEAEKRHQEQRRQMSDPEASSTQARAEFIQAIASLEAKVQAVIDTFASAVQEVDDLMRDAKSLQHDEGDPTFFPEDSEAKTILGQSLVAAPFASLHVAATPAETPAATSSSSCAPSSSCESSSSPSPDSREEAQAVTSKACEELKGN
ncbi:LETM1 family protein [Besnoitia besnoiti]|uniref:LETM1 family protein n=1 Tax=Besnoitia besnoiti TaxID=94643 RepID=A0A2A9M2K4_BESBE|nr:LETM1 family protein [Besnoitia besnoiti]PFH32205.1 LETM1 family protein [Besnoitia besnoiti]